MRGMIAPCLILSAIFSTSCAGNRDMIENAGPPPVRVVTEVKTEYLAPPQGLLTYGPEPEAPPKAITDRDAAAGWRWTAELRQWALGLAGRLDALAELYRGRGDGS